MTFYKPGDEMELTIDGQTVTREVGRIELYNHPAKGTVYKIQFAQGGTLKLYDDELMAREDTDAD